MKIRNFIGLSAAMALLTACSEKSQQPPSEVIVKTQKVVTYAGNQEKEYSFIAQPHRTSTLSFRVGGPIDRFEVYSGNYYSQGSTIAEIDPRDFLLRKEQTQAIYRQMEAEFQRIRKLYDRNNISASQFEKTRADYVSAKTAYNTAVNEWEDSHLKAPFNGYVGEVYIEKFQDVKATQPVLTLIDIDRLRIEAYVTQEVAAHVQKGDSVSIRFDLCPGTVYRAPVVEMSKGTTRNNLSYLLTALLPNPGHKLLSGMSGKVCIQAKADKEGLVIPQSALCHRPTEGSFVWVVDEGTSRVRSQKVEIDRLLPDGYALVRQGLKEQETIATTGLRFLTDDMKVTVSSQKN